MNSYSIESSADCLILRLDGDVTIEHAAALHKDLSAKATTGSPIVVDTQNLQCLDAAIIQVLIMADQNIMQRPPRNPKQSWFDSLQRYGITSDATMI